MSEKALVNFVCICWGLFWVLVVENGLKERIHHQRGKKPFPLASLYAVPSLCSFLAPSRRTQQGVGMPQVPVLHPHPSQAGRTVPAAWAAHQPQGMGRLRQSTPEQ